MGILIGGKGKLEWMDHLFHKARATSKNVSSVLVTPKAVSWKGS